MGWLTDHLLLWWLAVLLLIQKAPSTSSPFTWYFGDPKRTPTP